YAQRDQHHGNRVAFDRFQNPVIERPILTGARSTEHVVDDARDGHLVLQTIDGRVELGAAARDVLLQILQALRHHAPLSDRTSTSRLSERIVLSGASEDDVMVLRPHSPSPMAISAMTPPTMRP